MKETVFGSTWIRKWKKTNSQINQNCFKNFYNFWIIVK